MWFVYLAGDTPLPETHCVRSKSLKKWLMSRPNVYHKRLGCFASREEALQLCKSFGQTYSPPPPPAMPIPGVWPRKAPDWVPKGWKQDWLLERRAEWRHLMRGRRIFSGMGHLPYFTVNWLTGETKEYDPWSQFRH